MVLSPDNWSPGSASSMPARSVNAWPCALNWSYPPIIDIMANAALSLSVIRRLSKGCILLLMNSDYIIVLSLRQALSGMRSEPEADVVKQSGLGFLRLSDEVNMLGAYL